MTRLIKLPPNEWPRELGWLVVGTNCTPLGLKICQRALRDNGLLEIPNGSNRSPRIDKMHKRAGLTPGQWWCAIQVGDIYLDCDVPVPQEYPSTDRWLPFVREGGNKATPMPGDAVLYGLRKKGPVVDWGDSHHIGIIMRLPDREQGQLLTLTFEGNRGFAGTATNNGLGSDMGPMNRNDVLGYVDPQTLIDRFAAQQ